jgi:photosystem II stability/assembly factor-like uncharacterized protein
MKKSILCFLILVTSLSCKKIQDPLAENCRVKPDIKAPSGFILKQVAIPDFKGSFEEIQFVDDNVGFILGNKNAGGYAEIFKTENGGITWANLQMEKNVNPINMIFKNKDLGFISTQDVSGCPPPNCLNKCVVLKTENGGKTWQEIEYPDLKGSFYHMQFDEQGNLYGTLQLYKNSVSSTKLMKSIDDGKSWDVLYTSPDIDFSLTTFSFSIYRDKIFISGNNGKLIKINTKGDLLNVIETKQVQFWDVKVVDENNLVVVGDGNVTKTTDGGKSWKTIYDRSARIINFTSAEKGMMIFNNSYCENTDVYQANDVFAFTKNGGTQWIKSDEATNLMTRFSDSYIMSDGRVYILLDEKLIEIKEK